jgi:hypothetical protein
LPPAVKFEKREKTMPSTFTKIGVGKRCQRKRDGQHYFTLNITVDGDVRTLLVYPSDRPGEYAVLSPHNRDRPGVAVEKRDSAPSVNLTIERC